MRKVLSFIIAAGVLCPLVQALPQSLIEKTPSMAMQQLGQQSIAFTQNVGQWDEQVLYRANAGGATMWFTKDGAYYQFTRRMNSVGQESPTPAGRSRRDLPYEDQIPVGQDPRDPDDPRERQMPTSAAHDRFAHERDSIESIMIKASFVGANLDPNMIGLEEMEYKCNYFIGNDPDEWHTDVPNYEYILYQDVYPGIDLKYYGNGKQMEYDFIVSPGADPSQIAIRYEGAKSLLVNEAGELEVETAWNTVTEQAPFVYQETDGGRREVVGKYRLLENGTFGFALEVDYDSSVPLIIDPTLVYSTYLGGGADERGYAIAVDGSGSVYITGYTNSPDFPTTPAAYDTSYNGEVDAFVTKLSSTGNSPIYSTYLGGGDYDAGWGIAVDGSGNAYVTGCTYSSDFPTENPYQTDQGNNDAFVCKLSSSGNSLIYSTYLGGGSHDGGNGIAVDGSGNAYVTGSTSSSDFPTENPYQTYQGIWWDVFVTKLSSSGNSLIYSTFLGGGEYDYGYGIAVDGDGNVYITGSTDSPVFPTTPGAYDTSYNGELDAFVTKLSNSGNSLIYSTYLGGDDDDYGDGITIDGSGNAYVAGRTESSNFPTENPYQTHQGSHDVFVTKLSSSGNSLIYSTYIGGGSWDMGKGIAVDDDGYAYVTGFTSSSNFPTENPYQGTHQGGFYDAFVIKLSSYGNSLIYSTYLGGGSDDWGEGITVSGSGNAYVTGVTYSFDFPTQNSYQADFQGGSDAFVTKLSDEVQCGDMVFRPDPDGWRFANNLGNVWPQSWWQQFDYCQNPYPWLWCFLCNSSDFPDWPLFVSAFGEDQCYWVPPPGIVIYNPVAVARWFAMKDTWGGSCFGFAISSFLFFDEYLDLAAEFPGNANLYNVLINDQSREMVNEYWIYQFGRTQQQHINSNYNSTTPDQTLQACKEMFNSSDSQRDDRILVFLNNNGSGGHAVNPYRCEVDGSNPNLTYVYVYDNNAPNDETRRITFNTSSNTWSYASMPTWGGSWNIFLMNPISNYTSNPDLPKEIPPKERWISGERGAYSEYVEIFLPSADSVRMESSLGEIGQIEDSLFSDLSDGCPIIPITGEETPPIGYYLPNAAWETVVSGLRDSSFRWSLFTDSTAIVYGRQDVDSTQGELLNYYGDDKTLLVQNPDSEIRTYQLEAISTTPDSSIVCGILEIGISPGDSTRHAITDVVGLQLDNYGGAKTYGLRIAIAGATGETVYLNDEITLDSNSSHQIIPDWRPFGDSVMILVDSGMVGTFADTLFVENEGEPYVCGDADGSMSLNISDAIFLIQYIFAGGPPPDPLESGDANCDGVPNLTDAVYLIQYIFAGGPPPCDPDDDGVPDC